ncbi:TPA: restriction endonuclease subunit S [Pseudomonas aeruginosa]|uniref:restriction endonuclease subunit S n=1 Tax=Pseudomonas aeruginosa TaxID=287 RepID=UPI00228D8C4B|nr:restriction endonuclease subunit S [Pseudomonas aeruginosa]MDV7882177.1 restriction endonuclease subunit S [Pseudomonas aeruginosa]HCF7686930.1 restriction endonuclease subunit S [Pseudomonas aeruginosa]HCU0443859.1 restriction endonuclease subunit S [Pseudomonas aeruginosa]
MDVQQFLAEFGHIANAPTGVSKLRELVIQLAISGRLVERIESEAATSQAVEASAALRLAYERELDLRATRMHPPLDSRPFPIPDHWQWVRLEQICLYIQRGKGPTYVERSSTHVISQKCIQWAGFDISPARFVADDSLSSYGKERFLCEGDLLWNSTGTGTVGRVAIYHANAGIKAVADSHVTVLRLANCNSRYLWCVIASPWVQSRIEPSHPDSLVSGTTQQVELNTSTARALPIPLPPLEEQSRIVDKVDELMALCDKLEAQQQARRTLQNALRQSTLQAVANATSPYELQTNWARLADSFGQLFHVPEDVADLRKMVSELAIRGTLEFSKEPTDTSTVDVYLAELARKKSGKRFAKSVQVNDDIPLPEGWRWVLLEDLLSGSESGWSPKCEAEPRRGLEWGVLKVSAVTWGAFNPNENKRLPLSLEARPECEVKPGDFMLSRANTAELVARSVIAPNDCPSKLLMSDKIVRLNFLDDALKSWVNLVNNSELARTYYKERATGTSDSMRNVSRQVIHELPIPLPSLQVQERVLITLSRLHQYCDSLEWKVASRMTLSSQLSASAVSRFTGIAIAQEEEPMKAPQTELIAPLRLGAAPDIKAQAPLATILARHNGEMSAKDLWQRFGGEIDAFYAQLKIEVAYGWVLEPAPAEMREKPADMVIT